MLFFWIIQLICCHYDRAWELAIIRRRLLWSVLYRLTDRWLGLDNSVPPPSLDQRCCCCCCCCHAAAAAPAAPPMLLRLPLLLPAAAAIQPELSNAARLLKFPRRLYVEIRHIIYMRTHRERKPGTHSCLYRAPWLDKVLPAQVSDLWLINKGHCFNRGTSSPEERFIVRDIHNMPGCGVRKRWSNYVWMDHSWNHIYYYNNRTRTNSKQIFAPTGDSSKSPKVAEKSARVSFCIEYSMGICIVGYLLRPMRGWLQMVSGNGTPWLNFSK